MFLLTLYCKVSLSEEIYKYKSLHDIPYDEMSPTFIAEVNGEIYYFALGNSSIPTGINPVDGEDIALETAELTAKGKLAEYLQGGKFGKEVSTSKQYTSTEGKENTTEIIKHSEQKQTMTLDVEFGGGIAVVYTKAFKGKAFVVVAISQKSLDRFKKGKD